jgi:hypothetical protein
VEEGCPARELCDELLRPDTIGLCVDRLIRVAHSWVRAPPLHPRFGIVIVVRELSRDPKNSRNDARCPGPLFRGCTSP